MSLMEKVADESTEWALCNGLVMYSKKTGNLVAAPHTLFPMKWPRKLYEQAVSLSTDFNILVDNVAQNPDFLLRTLEG